MAISALGLVALPASAGPAPKQPAPPPVVRPLFELDRGHLDVEWTRAANGGLEAAATLHEPTLRIARQSEAPSAVSPQAPPPGTGEVVREASPFPVTVDRVLVHGGAVVLLDETVPGRELLRIHGIEASIENFSSQRERSGGLPTLVTVRGRIGTEGTLELFATINPWTGELDFVGRAQIVGLRLEELGGFLEELSDLRPTAGTLTVFMEFSVHDGRITGGVKPIFTNTDVAAADPGLFEDAKAWFAEGAIELFSDERPAGETLAAVVPIRGRVRQPQPKLWEAFVGVLENAFIEALAVGFSDLSPPTS